MLQDHSETRLQIAVVNYLNGNVRSGKSFIRVQNPFPGLVWLHPVNEFKDEKEAFWGKAKGILPGAADLLFWWKATVNTRSYLMDIVKTGGIELKTGSGLSANQIKFRDKFSELGGHYAICKTVAAVRDTLIGWGLVCKNMQAIEPAPSKADQQAAYMELIKPHD